MRRLPWWLAVVVAFVMGAAVGSFARFNIAGGDAGARPEGEVAALRTRLRDAESKLAARFGRTSTTTGVSTSAFAAETDGRRADRFRSAVSADIAPRGARGERADLAAPGSVDHRATPPGAIARPAAPTSVDAALERIYQYLDDRNSSGGPRWQRMRQLVDDLRAMGEAGTDALLKVLASGATSEERRTAAQLLGELKPATAMPGLQNVLDNSNDVLLRRAAATALGRMQAPETIPALDTLIANPNEDRFVRMSAARGLAQLGRPEGVAGLVEIFDEANPDGRGRDMAFRSLKNLDNDTALPFMRRVLASDAELSYRVDAIRYLTAHADRQALPLLQQVMQSPTEQPSVRDAAAQAHAALAGK